jgi:8-oxo-dGTP diphosphatase
VTDQRELDEWARRHTRVAAYALCVDAEGKILLCRIAPGYPATGSWTLPGGGIKFGESPAAAVLRELTEETGLIGRIDSLAFVHSTARQAQPDEGIGPWHSVRIVYRVSITGGELRDEVDESSDRAAWLSASELSTVPLVDLANATVAWLNDPTITFR